MNKEQEITAVNGYVMVAVVLAILGVGVYGLLALQQPLFIALIVLAIFLAKGFFIINPKRSRVLVLFGSYKGTVKDSGFWWANPFYSKYKITLAARNFDSERLKVNDKIGNPILISVILVWRVKDTYKAAFEVDLYDEFVRVQTDAAVRKLAGSYSYDNLDQEDEITLRSGLDEVNEALEEELAERLAIAGIEVMEARIGYLAYAPEIANSMLKRQQAVAIVAARKKIVEGAVSMVHDALNQLSAEGIVEFDDDKKASMASNLMVVLCSDKEATPVLNTGTLHS